jgi:hypothetical protein
MVSQYEPRFREREAEAQPPATQIVFTGLLRGFDQDTGIATFQVERAGRYEELTVAIHKNRNELYHALYQTLLGALDPNGRLRALHLRVALRAGEKIPELLFAEECSPEGSKRFTWAGTELRWTEELDGAVDEDFDWRTAQFASAYLEELLRGDANSEAMAGIQAEAQRIFLEQAQAAGLGGTPEEVGGIFRRRGSLREILGAHEHKGAVRYDTRYGFEQQNAHVRGDRPATIAALVNYCYQAAVVQQGAMRAAQAVYLSEGRSGSLAEAHQGELVGDHLLIAANPSLETHGKLFAAYSYETARGVIARLMSGAMDAAHIPAARPEIDETELDKQHVDVANSMHQQTLAALPPGADDPEDPLVRSGAYFATARNLVAGNRVLSRQGVGIAQDNAAPDRKDTPPPPPRTNRVAEAVHGGLKYFEGLCDGL